MIYRPKVSIVIPVYNGSNYLKEAIDSALSQTYDNVEVIVVNDGSSDGGATDEIAKSYGNKIRYFQKKNGGVATALNLGIEKMTGDYFSWLSHDDKYKPQKIEKQIAYLNKREDKDVILYSNYAIIDEHGEFDYACRFNHKMLENKPVYGLLRGNVNGITMLVPKAAFDEYGQFDTSLRCTQDYDMWYKMIKTYNFIHLEEVLALTRIHSQQDTQVSPKVVSEGNVLWIGMVEGLSDSEKAATEGSVLKFYLEMVKFLRQTPYNGALEHCQQKIEESAQTEEIAQADDVVTSNIASRDKVVDTYKMLVEEGQKRAAAYHLEKMLKRMARAGETGAIAQMLCELLIGSSTGLDEGYIKKSYVSKIGNKSKKPRLMFCSGHWLTGGMERVLSNLFYQLKDEYDLFLLTAYDGREGKIELPSFVTHIKMSNELFYGSYSQSALSFALIFDIDIVIGFMNLFNGQLDFYELCDGTHIKTVASNHELYLFPYYDPYFYGLIQKRIDIFKSLDATLWLTNFSAAVYGLVGGNSYLMPNPNTHKIQPSVDKHEDKIILCVGRFNDYIKRVDRMLRCFSIVSKTQPDARLVLVGKYDNDAPIRPGSEDGTTVNDLIKQLGIDDDRVEFVGEVSDIEKYYEQASLLLVTSMNEGFGMVINEAACFGVPSVCNKIPGLEDIITDGKNGYLTEQDDIDAMATAVNAILADEKLRRWLSDNAKTMVAKFDEVEVGKKWKYLFNTLLENSSDEKQKLNDRLAYEIKDYKDFSKVMFDELNKVIIVNHEVISQLKKPKYESTVSFISKKAKNKYYRLNKSLKTKGVLQTGKIIAKKSYHKVKRLSKNS